MGVKESGASAPRLLVLDSTPIGSRSATGQVKAQLLAGWPTNHLMQVACPSEGSVTVIHQHRASPTSIEGAVERAVRFDPEVIYCRPLDRPADFRQVTDEVLDALAEVPLVTHVMDDWPARLVRSGNPEGPAIEANLVELLNRSTHCFSIGDRMSEALQERYGTPFEPFANSVDEQVWTAVSPDRTPLTGPPTSDDPFVLRYSGALAEDMTYQSIMDVAAAVEQVAANHPVRLELSVLPQWKQRAEQELAPLRSVTVRTADGPAEEFRAFVAGADACILAYNFDSASADYVRLSVANKLPDYLGAGRPILAYGPADFASIELCERSEAAIVVSTRDVGCLADAITTLVVDADRRGALALAAHRFARTHFDAGTIRTAFQARLVDAAAAGRGPASLLRYSRRRHAHVRESTLMASLLRHEPRDSLMVDVGAHHGTELAPFLELGWRVFAFEPDPTNRAKLLDRHGDHPRLLVDDRAVSDQEQASVAFYRSDESTGISTLTPFRESHVASERVDIVRLDRFCRERAIERVDYLKVDTEGHDLHVLRSIDWDATPPAAIQAEFEDAKTLPLGYDFHDMAEFLVEKGYDVWVSEWHPVIQYGTRHDWCRLARYPTELVSKDAWGNFLAFRESVTEEQMMAALEASLELPVEQDRSTSPVAVPGRTRERADTAKEPVVPTPPSPSSSLRALTGPSSGGLSGRLGELLTAFQGLLLLPTLAAVALYALAAVLGTALDDPSPAILSAAAGGMATLAAVGVGVARARRERLRAINVVAQRAADSVDRLQMDVTRNGNDAHALLEQLEARVSAGEARTEEHQSSLRDLAIRHDVLDADGRRRQVDIDRRLSDLTRRIRHDDQASPPPSPRGHRHFAREASDDDLRTLLDEWGPRLGLFSDVRPDAAKRQLHYLVDRIDSAERRSVGRLATSTPDMLLRMLVARAAARDAFALEEPLHVLEIGTLFGVGLGLLGEACRGGVESVTLTAVDPLDGYYGPERPDILTGEVVDRQAFEHNLHGFPIRGDWRIIQTTNRQAIEQGLVGDRSYGVVVIDGDHHHDEVAFDFEAFRPFMTSGCYVVFDDYGADEWPDVAKYVDEHVAPDVDVQFLGASWRTAVARLVRPPR